MQPTTFEHQLPIYDLVLGSFDPTDLNVSYLNAANRVLGTQMELDELGNVQATLLDVIDQGGFDSLSIEEQELWATLRGIKRILVGDFSQPFQGDTLSNWPIFQNMMDEPENRATKTDGTALMVGSASVLSSVAFGHLAREIYGTKRTVIVDRRGSVNKMHTGNFIQADGFSLPFGDQSISVVHTHRLLSALVDDSRPFDEFPVSVFALIKEFSRVLPIGGQVFMNEALPGVTESMSTEDLRDSLGMLSVILSVSFNNNGLRWVIDQARLPKNPTFWHDQSRYLDIKTTQPINSIAVYAQKVEHIPDAQFSWAG